MAPFSKMLRTQSQNYLSSHQHQAAGSQDYLNSHQHQHQAAAGNGRRCGLPWVARRAAAGANLCLCQSHMALLSSAQTPLHRAHARAVVTSAVPTTHDEACDVAARCDISTGATVASVLAAPTTAVTGVAMVVVGVVVMTVPTCLWRGWRRRRCLRCRRGAGRRWRRQWVGMGQ